MSSSSTNPIDTPGPSAEAQKESQSDGKVALSLCHLYARCSPRRARLAGDLDEARGSIKGRLCQAEPTDADKKWRRNVALEALKKAEDALKRGCIDLGWRNLNRARRMELFFLEGDELLCRASRMRSEAQEKLHGWRKDAALTILPDGKADEHSTNHGSGDASGGTQQTSADSTSRIDRCALYAVALLLDEHNDNTYHKMRLVTFQLSILLTVFVLLMPAAVALMRNALAAAEVHSDNWVLLTVMIFGAIGGVLSGCRSLTIPLARRGRIPEEFATLWLTLARPLLGAGSGLVVYIFLLAGVLAGMLQLREPASFIALSFIGGFSERYWMAALEKVVERSGGKGQRQTTTD